MSEEVIARIAELGGFDLQALRPRPISGRKDANLPDDLEIIRKNAPDETTRLALANARLGQGRFRADLMYLWGRKCSVTGFGVEELLRASHVKPWSVCDDNEERLDPENGLLLSAHLDALFDAGLISFDEDGAMLLSKQLPEDVKAGLRLGGRLRKAPSERLQRYLAYHRVRVAKDLDAKRRGADEAREGAIV